MPGTEAEAAGLLHVYLEAELERAENASRSATADASHDQHRRLEV
jgi:hypothetical protein